MVKNLYVCAKMNDLNYHNKINDLNHHYIYSSQNGAWQRSGSVKGDNIALEITKKADDCGIVSNLEFESHHGEDVERLGDSVLDVNEFEPCDDKYTDHTPCQEQTRAMTFPRENMNYRKRHCPPEDEKLSCLIPAPKGYVTPFRLPKSRDYVPYMNAPHKSLTVEKAVQNWVQYEGNVFRFPGGGTMFPHGADAYIEQLASAIPVNNGTVRTALDTGKMRNIMACRDLSHDLHELKLSAED
ncbi:probable methyltransferase PMT2 [Primulina huaijiensis]|uniref:probable methyltransferase PMT2 n=1 Tax=Primulina huaijiensis TaxID=1492673 RepID=UPI003CC74C35